MWVIYSCNDFWVFDRIVNIVGKGVFYHTVTNDYFSCLLLDISVYLEYLKERERGKNLPAHFGNR